MTLIKEYRTDMQKNEFLLMSQEPAEPVDFYEKMLTYNSIPGLLSFRSDLCDGHRRYIYKADGKRRADDIFNEKKPGLVMLKKLVEGIMHAVEEAREYLFDEEDFVIAPDCIFLDEGGNPCICCFPGFRQPLKEQFAALFEYLMDKLDYEDKRAVVVLYELYRKSREPVCNFEIFKNVFAGAEGDDAGTKNAVTVDDTNPATAANYNDNHVNRAAVNQNAENRNTAVNPVNTVTETTGTYPDSDDAQRLKKKKGRSFFKGLQKHEKTPGLKCTPEMGNNTETGNDYGIKGKKINADIYDSNYHSEGTVLLYCPPEQSTYVLKAEDGKEVIGITKFPFFIGKTGANLNYELSYPQISRLHAKFTLRDGKTVVLEDLKSTNGSFVNGVRLTQGEQVDLKAGDIISFANRNYLFSVNQSL